jgi:predicted Zn-ribbon and HTH transcriptional regulator
MRLVHICNRCGYQWMSHKQNTVPKRCAGCNSPYWNKERKHIKN